MGILYPFAFLCVLTLLLYLCLRKVWKSIQMSISVVAEQSWESIFPWGKSDFISN